MAGPVVQLYSLDDTVGSTAVSVVSGTTSVSSVSTNVALQIWVDASAITSADEFLLEVFEKLLAGETAVAFDSIPLTVGMNKFVHPTVYLLGHGWDVRVKKISGTDRVIKVSLRGYTA